MSLKLIGIDTEKFFNFIVNFPSYLRDYSEFKRQIKDKCDFRFGNPIPILDDKKSSAGIASGQYFQQDRFVAKKIFENNPEKHVDVGSRVDGFVLAVSVFREIEVLDIRKLESKVSNIKFKQVDLMKLSENMISCCDSISTLHAIEHFGLGRYGDSIDYWGHEKALNNIHKILKIGGKFYFSTPIGAPSIQFNAHRIFGTEYLFNLFKDKYKINSFNLIDDNDNLIENVKITDEKIKSNFGCKHGCGIWEMTKI